MTPFSNADLSLLFHYNVFLIAGKIIDFTNPKMSLLDICLEETGGTGVDCIIDNGGWITDTYIFNIFYSFSI